MPELPEVETTIKGLNRILRKKIINVKIHTKKLRFNIPNNIKRNLLNTRITKIRRIAKYIILDLDNSFSLIFHLGLQ